jgi:hypothetical protein
VFKSKTRGLGDAAMQCAKVSWAEGSGSTPCWFDGIKPRSCTQPTILLLWPHNSWSKGGRMDVELDSVRKCVLLPSQG